MSDGRWLQLKPRVAPTPKPKGINGVLHKFADWIDDWHLVRIFQALGAFAILGAAVTYYLDQEDRTRERIVNSWQLVTTKAPGNSGKVPALEFLHQNGEPLTGIDLSAKTHGGFVHLRAPQLPQANLERANLSGANLDGANLRGANLALANFSGSNMRHAILTETDFLHANLTGAKLESSDFRSAQLWFAKMPQVELYLADLTGANLQSVDLSWANLVLANLTSSDLKNAILTNATLWEAKFIGANLQNANLSSAELDGADFTDAKFVGVNISNTNFIGFTGVTQEQLNSAWAWADLQPHLPEGLFMTQLCTWEEGIMRSEKPDDCVTSMTFPSDDFPHPPKE